MMVMVMMTSVNKWLGEWVFFYMVMSRGAVGWLCLAQPSRLEDVDPKSVVQVRPHPDGKKTPPSI